MEEMAMNESNSPSDQIILTHGGQITDHGGIVVESLLDNIPSHYGNDFQSGVYVNLTFDTVSYHGPYFHEWDPRGTIENVENVNGSNYADTLIGNYKDNVLN